VFLARQTAINIKPSGNEEPVVEDEGYFEDANVNFAKSLLRFVPFKILVIKFRLKFNRLFSNKFNQLLELLMCG